MCNGKLGRLMEKKSRGRGFVEEILEAELEFSNSWERGNIFPFSAAEVGNIFFALTESSNLKLNPKEARFRKREDARGPSRKS